MIIARSPKVKKFILSFLVPLLLSLLLLVVLLIWKVQKEREQWANVPLNNAIKSIDPANAYDLVSGSVVYQLYETLFEYNYLKRPFALQPLLAESLPTLSGDGKIYKIKIKKGVQYHPDPCFQGKTRYVTAEDFVNQLKRLAFKPTKSNGWWSIDGLIKGLDEFRKLAGSDLKLFQSLNVSGLKAIDESTLIIELNEPAPQLPYLLATAHTAPIPIEAILYYNNNLANIDVGSGPFQLQEWVLGKYLKAVRFLNYRSEFYPSAGDRIANDRKLLQDSGKKVPFLEGVTFHVYSDYRERWKAFMQGEVDYLDNVPKSEFSAFLTPSGTLKPELVEKNIHLEVSPSLTYWWLAFNMRDPVVGKSRALRMAIAHAIDLAQYVKLFTHNVGQQANSILLPGIAGYDPRNQLSYEYNVEKAKKYLREAGYSEKKRVPQIVFDTRGNDLINQKAAEFIGESLRNIGIPVKIALNTFPEFLEKAREGTMQFWQGGWSLDYPDSINILQLLSTRSFPPGPNNSYYSNRQFDQLYSTIKTMENGPSKFKLLKEMEDIVLHDLPWIMTYYDRRYVFYYDHLKNYRYSDLIYNYLKYVKVVH